MRTIKQQQLLATLGGSRGTVYFNLLLRRLHVLHSVTNDPTSNTAMDERCRHRKKRLALSKAKTLQR